MVVHLVVKRAEKWVETMVMTMAVRMARMKVALSDVLLVVSWVE